jgi:hypothetical protein
MQSWAAEELRYADLGDKRLNRRLIDIVSAKPAVSVPQALGKNKGGLPFLGQSACDSRSNSLFAARLSVSRSMTACC